MILTGDGTPESIRANAQAAGFPQDPLRCREVISGFLTRRFTHVFAMEPGPRLRDARAGAAPDPARRFRIRRRTRLNNAKPHLIACTVRSGGTRSRSTTSTRARPRSYRKRRLTGSNPAGSRTAAIWFTPRARGPTAASAFSIPRPAGPRTSRRRASATRPKPASGRRKSDRCWFRPQKRPA